MKKAMSFLLIIVILVTTFSFYSQSVGAAVAVKSVALNRKVLTLGVKESFTLTKIFTPANTTNKKVTWYNSNKNVLSSDKGKLIAKKAGTAIISIKTSNGKTATCKVTVKNAPSKITVTPAKKTIIKGNSFTLKYSLPKNTASNKIIYSTSNKNVATVTATGKVTAKNSGTAKITVKTYNGIKALCTVMVNEHIQKKEKAETTVAAKSIALNRKALTLGVKETFTLTKIFTPANTTNKNVTWYNSNKDVLSSDKGKLIAKKAGTAIISIKTSNGKTATCKVTVKNAPSKITVTPAKKTIITGTSFSLKYSLPTNTASNSIIYSTSNKNVATVTATGKVTAKNSGTAKITVKTYNGLIATCIVNVIEEPLAEAIPLTKEQQAIQNYNYLISYINNHYDSINSNGNKLIKTTKYTNDSEYTVGIIYNHNTGELEIIELSEMPGGDITTRIRINIAKSFIVTPETTFSGNNSGFKSTTTIDVRTYTKKSTYHFSWNEQNFSSEYHIIALSSENIALTIGLANILIQSRTNLTIKDIGFFSVD